MPLRLRQIRYIIVFEVFYENIKRKVWVTITGT